VNYAFVNMPIDTTRPDPYQGELPGIAEMMRGRLALAPISIALVAVNVLVFAVMVLRGAGFWHSTNDIQFAWGASFGPAIKDGEWYRLFAAMFLHFGLVHLAINMLALWEGGRLVERLYGSLRFAIVYIASGLAGNLLSLVIRGDHAVSGGASGAIFGLYGALLVILWRERRQLHPVDFRWIFGGALAFSVVTIVLGLLIQGIDNAAHIGGLTAGVLMGGALVRPLSPASPVAGLSRWLSAGTMLLAIVVLVAVIPAPSYRWKEELQTRAEIRAFLRHDELIRERWQSILDTGSREATSFEGLAQRLESSVTQEYLESFEQLSALNLDPSAPSAFRLDLLKRYAQRRAADAHSLAEALRMNDRKRIRDALERARQAPDFTGLNGRQGTPDKPKSPDQN